MPPLSRVLLSAWLVCACRVSLAQDLPSLYIIGDSTASTYPSERAPRTGWGQVLQECFDPSKVRVDNRARSGRSSKSFLDEGAWQPIVDALKPGDFVIVQFGHNDSKSSDPARFTDPKTTYKECLRRYVEDTRSKGATPILATPIYRCRWVDGRIQDTHGDYPPAMRELAKDMDVALLDLHKFTGERFQELGEAGCRGLFMYLAKDESPNYPEGVEDGTHLRGTGAREVCRLVVRAVQECRLPLARFLTSHDVSISRHAIGTFERSALSSLACSGPRMCRPI